jgi:hypothetical protein
MFTSFKNHLNWGDGLYLLISNFVLDDPRESGAARIEMHSGFLLMVLSVKRQQNTIKKNPEALLHARKEI